MNQLGPPVFPFKNLSGNHTRSGLIQNVPLSSVQNTAESDHLVYFRDNLQQLQQLQQQLQLLLQQCMQQQQQQQQYQGQQIQPSQNPNFHPCMWGSCRESFEHVLYLGKHILDKHINSIPANDPASTQCFWHGCCCCR